MGNYGNAAIAAARSLASRQHLSPRDAWDQAVAIEYPTQTESRKKGCPRGAFLGLREAGLVKGVRLANSCNSTKNGGYAIGAVEALRRDPTLLHDKLALWRKACADQPKVQNGQMDVVVALANAELLKSV